MGGAPPAGPQRPGLRSASALSARDACEGVVRAAGSWRGRWTFSRREVSSCRSSSGVLAEVTGITESDRA
ncbi:hypothetical protein CapIbe_019897 [Capra ibex]